ncbi:MAG: helix-turn-helix domain-containing protein [Candidatus Eremiobacteraeota bacterium]|nr:helix-turn-helix domain-containing protein [Candidatus Eremiobacteraeota bacterium]
MSDFLSLEESAEQLGVSDGQLRSWIKRGLARATRRGGDYLLRPSEVDRLRHSPPSAEEAAPVQRPRVLPPRSEKNPDTFAGERDRRRRMGRRASDFTLEILHQEIKSAIGAAMEQFRPIPAAVAEPVSHPYEIEVLEQRILELEGQLRHQDLAREEFRQRLEESERLRQELEAARRELEKRLQESEGARHDLEQMNRQAQQHDDGTQQLLQRLSREVALERQLRQEAADHAERLRAEIEELQSSSLAMDAERARWSLENRSLQGEIDRLTSMQESWEQQKRELEQSGGDHEKVLRERDDEIRRLREQVTSLTYKLQMAGSGATGTSPEESRRLVERLAEAQAEMAEKNELVNQTYAEIGELRSKLDAVQRSHYELQQRHERLKDEWGQLAAQVAAKQMSDHQQQQAPPPPGPGERPKGWGSLFGRRD